MDDSQSAWRSLMIYFGGLTFDPKEPATYLRVPNKVAAKRIATAVLERYNLRESFKFALQNLVDDGEIERVLSCYRDLMTQRDVTVRGSALAPRPCGRQKGQTISLREIIGRLPYMRATVTHC
jgi:hypothetical protein